MVSKPDHAAPRETLPPAVRKIIQIAPMASGEHYVLCDDGSVWIGVPGVWNRADVDKIITDPAPPP